MEGAVVGYAVYQFQRDEYDPDQRVVYLRQFYIERARRGEGLGRRAFDLLAQTRFPPASLITIDVLSTNPGAVQVWRKVGFQSCHTTMHFHR